MKTGSEIRRMVEQARNAGWRIASNGSHWRIYPPQKRFPPISCSTNTKDTNAPKNLRASLKEAGLNL